MLFHFQVAIFLSFCTVACVEVRREVHDGLDVRTHMAIKCFESTSSDNL